MRLWRKAPVRRAAVGSSWPARQLSTPAETKNLSVLCFLGSTRIEGPPFPTRVGSRVAAFCANVLRKQGHSVEVIDPLELDLPLLRKPQFAYQKGKAPENLTALADKIRAAEAFVMVSPEYNHSASPALLNTLNHFPSSIFSYKPSAICTYSQGQWGGARAAMSLRPILSELGCLPVSAMIHVPSAHTVFDEHGQANEEADWESYFMRTFGQMEWWAQAAKRQKQVQDPFKLSPALRSTPSQRNAPK
mmetsp:Transcript_44677/g.83424  ORF Transcript_44677/g.83424 Transcript_44677/m.83424 type:complete len:247 (-) Transcript_44677:22-762(-)